MMKADIQKKKKKKKKKKGYYQQLLHTHQENYRRTKQKINGSVQKLNEVNALDEKMQERLSKLESVFTAKNRATEEMLVKIKQHQAEVDKMKETFSSEDKIISKQLQAKHRRSSMNSFLFLCETSKESVAKSRNFVKTPSAIIAASKIVRTTHSLIASPTSIIFIFLHENKVNDNLLALNLRYFVPLRSPKIEHELLNHVCKYEKKNDAMSNEPESPRKVISDTEQWLSDF